MSQITSEILGAMAPHSPRAKRDRFLPFLNEALPRYGICNELQVSGFLATACFESMYFQATREGRARLGTKARRAQDRYWSTGFIGRGIFQTTHEANYEALGEALTDAGVIDDPGLFLDHPELLEQPRWAVESACQYWKDNNLDRYAKQGLKGFFALQGRVNRGDATKEAWGYHDRLIIYENVRRILPDDFQLDSSANAPADSEPTNTTFTPGVVPDEPDVSTGDIPNDPAPPDNGNALSEPQNSEPSPISDTTVAKLESDTPGGTVSSEQTTFTPQTITQYVPKITGARRWLGTLTGLGFFSTSAAAIQGLPTWVICLLGALTAMVIAGLVVLVIKYKQYIFAMVRHAMAINADPTTNNVALSDEKPS